GQGAGRVGGTGCDRAHRAGLAGRGARFGRGDTGAHMRLDAVGLEVMAHAFASIAEEMGLVLVHSALSPNIRERRDASAALFDADGEMIAQAAHIPVHLGALADAVAAVRSLEPQPGDLFILNDPYSGGSHLPDLTLIGAIEIDGQVGGYSVVRAHHSDVGGMTPGSMPASARELYQEGIIIPPTRLTLEVERLLLANVRTPAMRRGDLAAQRAAVERGAQGLRALGGAVRGPHAAARRRSDERRRAARDRSDGAAGLSRECAAAECGCRGQCRDVAANCGHGLSRTCGRRLRRAGAGSGDDEQRDVWRNRESGVRSLDLLRNDWRRAGRESRGQRTVGCPRRDRKSVV